MLWDALLTTFPLELKEQAEEDEIENLILLLADDEDYHDKIKQIDPNWVNEN